MSIINFEIARFTTQLSTSASSFSIGTSSNQVHLLPTDFSVYPHLIHANYLVVDGNTETATFRAYVATAGGHSVMYPYPELLPKIQEAFYL